MRRERVNVKKRLKTLTIIVMAAVMIFGGLTMTSISGEPVYGASSDKATVYVTMSVKGDIAVADGKVMAEVPVEVKADNGMTTIDAVMEAFHKAYKPEGYQCGEYVTKLWGIETGNTLFFINNLSITSGVKYEPVKDGDRVTASVNGDDKYYSDYYSYFDQNRVTGVIGTDVTLMLKGFMGMTQNAEPEAVKGAQLGIVTKDGFQKLEGVTTDEDGRVVVTLDQNIFEAGQTYLLSAKGTVATTATDWSAEGTPVVNVDAPLIAPICRITVDSRLAGGVKATKITSIKAKASKGKISLTWKKSAGYKVDGYQIWKSAKKTGTYKKIASVKSKSFIDGKGLKKGSRYYYKVRGYRAVDGKAVYTQWSAKVNGKAK